MKFDLHCHTKGGSIDARTPLSRYIEILKSQGFGGLLVTDHDSYRGCRQWREDCQAGRETAPDDFVVLEGVEYDTRDAGHILVILPDDVQLDVLQVRGLDVETLIGLVHHFGGILGPAHPFGAKSSSMMHMKKIPRHPHLIKKFDFIEGFNACESMGSNYFAQGLAAFWDKPCIGGSDAHGEDSIGQGWTEFDVPIRSNDDLIEAVRGWRISDFGGTVREDSLRRRFKEASLSVACFRLYNRFLGLVFALRRRRHISKLSLPHPAESAAE